MSTRTRATALVLVAGCLVGGGNAFAAGEDRFEVTAGPSELTIEHFEAEYNCCLASIDFEAQRDAFQLSVNEIEDLGPYPCYCLCLYTTRVSFDDLEAGLWDVCFTYEDRLVQQTEHWQIEIPEATAGGDVNGMEVWFSDCGAVPVDVVAWSALKRMYR